MFLALLPLTGQNQATLTVVLIVGAVLVILGVLAMVAVRVSRKKNAAATVYKPAPPVDETK